LLDDASVRVYVHRLRRKLEDHYGGPGADEPERLVLPKGDYRFQVESNEPATPEPPEETASLPPVAARPSRTLWLALVGGLVAGGLIVFAAMRLMAPDDGLGDVRASPVWASLIADNRPLTIVAGDYYIMGERDKPGAEPARLVRDFAVNSREELDALVMNRPELRDRSVDLNLSYLPVGAAYALRSVMPILTPGLGGRRAVPVIASSRLTPAQFKDGDLVYVGLLSGLGLLEEPVLANSRFGIGGSFDEIIDSETGRVYVADPPRDEATARRNYAYVAMLPGPNGNRILIVAGTRDPALLQAADLLSSPAALKALAAAGKDGFFEALYAVDGVGDENLKGTLIAAGPRTLEGLWDGMLDPPGQGARVLP
jgi:hypothetical protein